MQGENNNPSVNGIFDLSLQQFVIQDARITNELDTQNGFTNQRITLNFRLERRIMYFVLQSYVPCTLITILRYFGSIWMEPLDDTNKTSAGFHSGSIMKQQLLECPLVLLLLWQWQHFTPMFQGECQKYPISKHWTFSCWHALSLCLWHC